MVGPHTSLGIKNLYKNPDEVGADRLVNAVAVHALYRKALSWWILARPRRWIA